MTIIEPFSSDFIATLIDLPTKTVVTTSIARSLEFLSLCETSVCSTSVFLSLKRMSIIYLLYNVKVGSQLQPRIRDTDEYRGHQLRGATTINLLDHAHVLATQSRNKQFYLF